MAGYTVVIPDLVTPYVVDCLYRDSLCLHGRRPQFDLVWYERRYEWNSEDQNWHARSVCAY